MILSYAVLSALMLLAVALLLFAVSSIGKPSSSPATSASAVGATALYLGAITGMYLVSLHLSGTWTVAVVASLLSLSYGAQMVRTLLATGTTVAAMTPKGAVRVVSVQLLQLVALAFLISAVR